jgi:hypothetical protein
MRNKTPKPPIKINKKKKERKRELKKEEKEKVDFFFSLSFGDSIYSKQFKHTQIRAKSTST